MYNPFNSKTTCTDESTININSDGKQLFGIAQQYKKQLGTSKFKLIVYWERNTKGEFYTFLDKQYKKNRRYIPSFDFKNGVGGKTITDHELGYNNLVQYCLEKAHLMEKAILILNDYINEQELTILNFNPKDIQRSVFVAPIFKPMNENGYIYFDKLENEPIRIDKMRF